LLKVRSDAPIAPRGPFSPGRLPPERAARPPVAGTRRPVARRPAACRAMRAFQAVFSLM